MPQDSLLNCLITREVMEALVKAAKDDSRSVSSLIRLVMLRWLCEGGYLAASEPADSRDDAQRRRHRCTSPRE